MARHVERGYDAFGASILQGFSTLADTGISDMVRNISSSIVFLLTDTYISIHHLPLLVP